MTILLAGAGIFWFFGGKKLGGNKIISERKQGNLMPFQEGKENSDWENVLLKASAYTDINASSSKAIDTNSEPLSETEKFSQDFFTRYLLAKQAFVGENLDDATKQNLINSAIADLDFSSPLYYKLSDLKISGDNSETAVRNYGTKLIAIVNLYNNPGPGDEISVFEEMVRKNNESMASQLDKSVIAYNGLIKDIMAVNIPSEIADQHLKLINSFVLFKKIAEKLRNYFSDPMAGFVALKQYQEAATNYTDSLAEINKFLSNKLK